jgi:hypothetical protein
LVGWLDGNQMNDKRKSTGENEKEPGLNIVNGIYLCDPCLDGAGGECHTPGCALWLCYGPITDVRDHILMCGGEIIPLDKTKEKAPGGQSGA